MISSDNRHYENVGGKITDIENDIPFDVPEGWIWVRVEDIAILISGQDLQSNKYNENGIGIPYITGASNFENDQLLINRWTNEPKIISLKNDLLLTCKGTIGKMIFLQEDCAHIARQIMAIRANSAILNEYLKICIESYLSILHTNAKSMIPGIMRSDVLHLFIPLPPLAEQKRIAKTINKIYSKLISIEKENIKLLQETIFIKSKILDLAIRGKLVPQDPNDEPASVLLERIRTERAISSKGKRADSSSHKSHYEKLAEKPSDLPLNWEFVKLSELCWLENGESCSDKELPYFDVKYLRGKIQKTLLTRGNFVKANEKVILVDGENSGEVFTVPECGYLGSTFRILKISEQISKEYIQIILDIHRKMLRDNKTGSAIPHLNKRLFAELVISLPPFREQERIVVIIKSLFQQIDLIQK